MVAKHKAKMVFTQPWVAKGFYQGSMFHEVCSLPVADVVHQSTKDTENFV